jgi:cytochrome c peroxidase
MRLAARSRQLRLLGAVLVSALGGCGLSGTTMTEGRKTGLVLAPIAGLDVLVPVPDDNPLTLEAVALGERLFFDPRLSADGTIRCASCHQPEHGFSDTARISRGVYGRRGERNAPPLVNRAYGRAFFWDGRATTLEVQVLHPIRDSVEMGQPIPTLIERLRSDRSYRPDFARSFGENPIDSQSVARALASYVRTLRSGNAPVDRWRDGDSAALSPSERRGLALFSGQAGCISCHAGPNFTDEDFHNTGVSARAARYATREDSGRARVTKRTQDVGAFKTPTLRDVARTGPYMHDGSLATLDDVVAFYDSGGVANPQLDADIKPLVLTEEQRRDLVAFLFALTGTTSGRTVAPAESRVPNRPQFHRKPRS